MVITEDNFVEEMKKGNEKALDYVIDEYGWLLKSVLRKHLFYFMDSFDECMNDCLLGIWENIEYFNPEKSSFKNWIGGIAKYKSIDLVRKQMKYLDEENIDDLNIPIGNTPLKEIIAQEISEETEKMLSTLSEEDRLIFIRHYLKDQDLNEISEDMNLSKPVLYNRLSRGRKKIRENFSYGGEQK
ncbi:MAG: sigma-70 family RNA polymerase sigma factor [Tissierellia bacterium]|nr:sigma-70 family RNA polymerase sigma factor [Tissierellia bacterium]